VRQGVVLSSAEGDTNWLLLAAGHLSVYKSKADIGKKMARALFHLSEKHCFVSLVSETSFCVRVKQRLGVLLELELGARIGVGCRV